MKSYSPQPPLREEGHLVYCLPLWGPEPSKPGRHPEGAIWSAPAPELTSRGRGGAEEVKVLKSAQKPGLGCSVLLTPALCFIRRPQSAGRSGPDTPFLGLKFPICRMRRLERTVCENPSTSQLLPSLRRADVNGKHSGEMQVKATRRYHCTPVRSQI